MLQSIYRRWKSLNLPWRRKVLAGYDLHGSTYWEIKSTGAHRPRRIVHHRDKLDFVDYERRMSRMHFNHLCDTVAQWLNWLRYTRLDPPTLEELQTDRQRIARVQMLAKDIDEKWSSTQNGDSPSTKA